MSIKLQGAVKSSLSLYTNYNVKMSYMLARKVIEKEEGFRTVPYYCTERFPTIGYGRVIGKKNEPLPNITTTKDAESIWLNKEIVLLKGRIVAHFPKAWNNCNEARQAILISMCYQLGLAGVSAFKKMWAAIEASDWKEASKQMLDSKWARQTPNRAKRHAQQMESGLVDNYYR
jgi:lysozyme